MFHIDSEGWLYNEDRSKPVRHCASPNYNQRPPATTVDLLVIHNISLPPGQFGGGGVEALFCNQLDCAADPAFAELRGLEVSAHLFIDRGGVITQFVSLNNRAWHAGQSYFEGRSNCNDFSIGIELEGTDTLPYCDVQYEQLAQLTTLLCDHFPALTPQRIVGHSDIAPERKTDPGPAFDWMRYKQQLRIR
jgi:N-acetyl-anhydromuramoyl-L-alanine amidase